jgi:hypothetical protein
LKALFAASGLKSFDGMINLTFTFSGRPGDLLVSTGSVDQTGNYVFQVQPEAAKKSFGKEIAFWSVADGSDTMISLWNPLNAAQDMAVTFHYADGSGEYRLPVHLPAKADTMISVAELKMMGRADINGSTFSATVKEGRATLTNLTDSFGELTAVVSAGTFNVRTATCGGGCNMCRGTSNLAISGASSIPVGTTSQFQVTITHSDGSVSHDPTGVALSSSNASVASVNSAVVVSANSAGSADIQADLIDVPVGGYCPLPPTYDGGCPLTASYHASQSVTVRVPYAGRLVSTVFSRPMSCPTGYAGWDRGITEKIVDQFGQDFVYDGILMQETISIGRNDFGLSCGDATCSGQEYTYSGGTFDDRFFFCAAACPASTGETDAVQVLYYNGVTVHNTNLLVDKCNQILWNAQ